jgi:hypothetical protein
MEEMIRRNEWPFTAGWLVIASARGVSLPAGFYPGANTAIRTMNWTPRPRLMFE